MKDTANKSTYHQAQKSWIDIQLLVQRVHYTSQHHHNMQCPSVTRAEQGFLCTTKCKQYLSATAVTNLYTNVLVD